MEDHVEIAMREVSLSVDPPFGAAMIACRAVIPGMISRWEGHIVNLTSPAGYFPLPFMVPYTASRHAMVGMCYSLREELEQYGIGVSVVRPAPVNTGCFERNDADMGWYPRLSRWFPVLAREGLGKRAVQAIRENRRELSFPWQLALLTNVYRRMPVNQPAAVQAAAAVRTAPERERDRG